MPTVNQVHSCPFCDQPCSCENWSYGESCTHCDGDEEPDAEPTSRSIDRENAAAINRDNKREHR